MSLPELTSLWLTAWLALVTTAGLLLVGTPLAWWLARSRSRAKPIIEAITALPLVLPPTVLGFYLLLLMSPDSALGGAWIALTGNSLTFAFSGLVIASMLYSLPFMVQPLQSAFEAVGNGPLEAAASLGATPRQAFFAVLVPQAGRGFLTACVLTFAHTLGEFGVVLMVGGNIPGVTRVISIEIYEQVETLQYAQAHGLSALLLLISFSVLLVVYSLNRWYPIRVG